MSQILIAEVMQIGGIADPLRWLDPHVESPGPDHSAAQSALASSRSPDRSRQSSAMPGPLPTLPADVLGRIACAALVAEGINESLDRLSRVCRAWGDVLRGALGGGSDVLWTGIVSLAIHPYQCPRNAILWLFDGDSVCCGRPLNI